MAILVTGGSGYIGSHISVELLNEGYELIIVDNLSNSNIKALDRIKELTNKDFKFYNVDLTNEYSVIINEFNMDEEDYKNIYLNSVKACFANDEIKNKLKRYI